MFVIGYITARAEGPDYYCSRQRLELFGKNCLRPEKAAYSVNNYQ
jgi:hypothetical protein